MFLTGVRIIEKRSSSAKKEKKIELTTVKVEIWNVIFYEVTSVWNYRTIFHRRCTSQREVDIAAREYTQGTISFLLFFFPPFFTTVYTRKNTHTHTHARTLSVFFKLIHNCSNAESIHRVRRVQYPSPLLFPAWRLNQRSHYFSSTEPPPTTGGSSVDQRCVGVPLIIAVREH